MATSDTTAGAQATTESAAGTATTQQQTSTTTAEAGKTAGAGETQTTSTTPAGTTTETAQGTGAEPKGKAGEQTAQPKAPEKYELRIPDGGERYIGAADLQFVEQVARANHWTQEDAQAELNDAVTRSQARETAIAAQFLETAKADRDYGGSKFEDTKQLAQRAIDRLRPAGHARRDSFLAFIERGGALNNIEVLSFLADLGKAMSEDAPGRTPSAGVGSSGDVASKFYDHPTSRAANGQG